jgi:hypothetical protein
MSTPEHEALAHRMKKAAEALATNDRVIPGKYVVREDPPGREARPAAPGLNYAGDYGTGTEREAIDTRKGVLDRVFENMAAMRNADRAVISQNFTHGSSGDYEAHSSLLGKSKTAGVVHDDGSLTDRVRAVAGRR